MGLDNLEILLSVEKEFGVVIDDTDAATLTTPRLFADYVAARRGSAGAAKTRHGDNLILRRVIQIPTIQTGIPAEGISPDQHFVHDLGLD